MVLPALHRSRQNKNAAQLLLLRLHGNQARAETLTELEAFLGKVVTAFEKATVTMMKYEDIESWIVANSGGPSSQKHNAQRMFAWLLFTGMRPFEAVRFWTDERWGWKLISDDLKFIRVPKAISKTRRSRVIEVLPTLRTWLECYRGHKSFMTHNWRDKYLWTRQSAPYAREDESGHCPSHADLHDD